MSRNAGPTPENAPKPDQVGPDFQGGYQPKASGPVDPSTLRPPREGTAIEPPRSRPPQDKQDK